MTNIHNHHGHTRPDEKMGRRKQTGGHPDGPANVRNPGPSSAQRQVEQRRAAKKRRQRDRSESS